MIGGARACQRKKQNEDGSAADIIIARETALKPIPSLIEIWFALNHDGTKGGWILYKKNNERHNRHGRKLSADGLSSQLLSIKICCSL